MGRLEDFKEKLKKYAEDEQHLIDDVWWSNLYAKFFDGFERYVRTLRYEDNMSDKEVFEMMYNILKEYRSPHSPMLVNKKDFLLLRKEIYDSITDKSAKQDFMFCMFVPDLSFYEIYSVLNVLISIELTKFYVEEGE